MESDILIWWQSFGLAAVAGLVLGWVAAYIGERRAKYHQLLPLTCVLGFMGGVGSAFMTATLFSAGANFAKLDVLPLALASAVVAMITASLSMAIGRLVRRNMR